MEGMHGSVYQEGNGTAARTAAAAVIMGGTTTSTPTTTPGTTMTAAAVVVSSESRGNGAGQQQQQQQQQGDIIMSGSIGGGGSGDGGGTTIHPGPVIGVGGNPVVVPPPPAPPTEPTPTATPEIDDLAPMLLERLEEKRAERNTAQTKIQRLNIQLQKLQSSSSSKHRFGRRETPEQIDIRIAQLERRRTTTSLTLGEEKKVLREMESYERLKRLEYDIIRLRDEINKTRDYIRLTNAPAIVELENALSKIELARRMGCRTSQLRERCIICPLDRISRVVGKNGAMISHIEKRTGVQIEIDRGTTTTTTSDTAAAASSGGGNGGEGGAGGGGGSAWAAATPASAAVVGLGGGRKIRLVGSESALDAAEEEILNITLAVEEQFEISKALTTYLLHKRGAALSSIRRNHPKVNVDLTGRTLLLRGRPERVSIARSDVLGLDVRTASVPIKSSRQIGVILGKGGSNVQRVQEEHGVSVDVVDSSSSATGKGGGNVDERGGGGGSSAKTTTTTTRLDIVGLSQGVEAAHAELSEIVYQNEDVVESMEVSSDVRNMFLDNSGAVVREIQNELGGYARLYFEKKSFLSSSEEDEQQQQHRVPSNLVLTTRRCDMSELLRLVRERIIAYESTVISMDIDPEMIPYIIGKGGATIRSLQELGSGNDDDDDSPKEAAGEGGGAGGATVTVFKETSSVTIRSESEETRNLIQKQIQDIVDRNQTRMIPIEKNIIGAVFGEAGKELKKSVVEDIGAIMLLSSDDNKQTQTIVLRGTKEQIDDAACKINDFLDLNFTVEIPVDGDEEQFLFQGGVQDSVLSKIEAKHSVSASVVRSKKILNIRGREEDAVRAKEEFEIVLRGGDGIVIVRVDIPPTSRGIILGKEGSQLKQLELDYEGVTATLLRSSDVLVLRGEEDQVKKCRSRVFVRLATAMTSENITLGLESLQAVTKGGGVGVGVGGGGGVLKEISENYGVQINLEGSTIKIRGVRPDVADAKARIMEITTGRYITCMPLEKIQVEKLKKALEVSDASQQHFQQISDSTKAIVSLDEEEECIKMEGKRSNVKKAKFLLLKYLDFLLPSQFAKVTLPKQSVRTVGSAATLASISCESNGAFLFLDRDLSCVHIRSSDPSKVIIATNLVKTKLEEADSKSCTIQLEPYESWLIPKIIGKGGSTINEIRKDCGGCNIHCSRDDLSLSITGEKESDVMNAKHAVLDIIENGRKEFRFVELPEGSMTSFIGKGGANVKKFEAEYKVSIHVERIGAAGGGSGGGEVQGLSGGGGGGGSSSGVRIQSFDEDALLAATQAAKAWITEWESNNAVKTIRVESAAMAMAIVGKKGSVITALEQDTGCKIHVNRDSRIVSLSGREECRVHAEKRITDIVDAERKKIKARMTAAIEQERGGVVSNNAFAAATSAATSMPVAVPDQGVSADAAAANGGGAGGGGGGGVGEDSTENDTKASSSSQKAKFPAVPVGVSPSDYASLYANQPGGGVVGGVSAKGKQGGKRGVGGITGKESYKQTTFHTIDCLEPNPYVTDAGKQLLNFLTSNDANADAEMLEALSLTAEAEAISSSSSSSRQQQQDSVAGDNDGDAADGEREEESGPSSTDSNHLKGGGAGGYYRSSGGFVVRL